MKSLALTIAMMACGRPPSPPLPDVLSPKDNPIEYVDAWLDNHVDLIPTRASDEIRRLFQFSEAKNHQISSAMAYRLSHLEYIKESSKIEVMIGNPPKKTSLLGVCTSYRNQPLGIEVLNKDGFTDFNISFFGEDASLDTLDALTDMVYIHELGHCLGGLKHSVLFGSLIMQEYIGEFGVDEYMGKEEYYIDQMLTDIETNLVKLYIIDSEEEDDVEEVH